MSTLDTFGSVWQPPQAPSGVPQVPRATAWWDSHDESPPAQDASAAIAVDQTASLALARAWTTGSSLKMNGWQNDRAAAQAALAAQKKLNGSAARTAAAQQALDEHSAVMRANPNPIDSGYNKNYLNALKSTLAKAQVAQATAVGGGPAPAGKPHDAVSYQMDVTSTITADQNAALAVARAWTSKKLNMATANADRAAAVVAVAAHKQKTLGSDARTKAAQDGFAAAVAKAQVDPSNVHARHLANAWKMVLAKAQAAKSAVAVQSSSLMGDANMDGSDGLDCFGCDEIGFGLDSLGPLFQAGSGMAAGAISDHEKDEAKKKATAADKSAADKAISADVTATLAAAKALTSAKLKEPSASIDQVAATNAAQAQDRAASGLSSSAADLRAHAADDALNAAVAKAQAAPKDVYPAALVQAWTATANKAQNRQIISGGEARGKGDVGSGENWFSQHTIIQKLPNYGTLGLGAALAGAATFAFKRFF